MSSKVFAYSIILGVCFVMDSILIFFFLFGDSQQQ